MNTDFERETEVKRFVSFQESLAENLNLDFAEMSKIAKWTAREVFHFAPCELSDDSIRDGMREIYNHA